MENLKEKVKKWFYFINHAKYKHYFDEWYENLTEQQLNWFKNHF